MFYKKKEEPTKKKAIRLHAIKKEILAEDLEKKQMPKRCRKTDRDLSLPMKTVSPPAKRAKPAKQAAKQGVKQVVKQAAIDIPAGEASQDLKDLLIGELIKQGKVRVLRSSKK